MLITHQIDEAVFLSDRVFVFTARPGRLKEEIVVELPRPRILALKRTAEFVSYTDRDLEIDRGRSSRGNTAGEEQTVSAQHARA